MLLSNPLTSNWQRMQDHDAIFGKNVNTARNIYVAEIVKILGRGELRADGFIASYYDSTVDDFAALWIVASTLGSPGFHEEPAI